MCCIKELWSNIFLRQVLGSEHCFGSGWDPQIALTEVALLPRPCFRCTPRLLALEQRNLTVTVWAVSPLVSRTHASSLPKLKTYSSSSSFVHLSRYCLQLYRYFQPSAPIYQLLPQLFPCFLLCHSLCSHCELPDFLLWLFVHLASLKYTFCLVFLWNWIYFYMY